MAFRFRQFVIEDHQSTMKVGTDAMILGAWAEPGDASRILDIGTGCGVLALMLAQKSTGSIDAVDLDLPSVQQAARNTEASAWRERITVHCRDIAGFSREYAHCYDFIITNPPFFGNSLRSEQERKNRTRHDATLRHEDLIEAVCRLLNHQGRCCLILPSPRVPDFIRHSRINGLFLTRSLEISPKQGLPPKRTALELSKTRVDHPTTGYLAILDETGQYSSPYLKLTSTYHHFNP